jgi:formylglycine-generating enzyme
MRPCLIALLIVVAAPVADAAPPETWRDPLTGVEFIRVARGCFKMGVPERAFASDHADVHDRAKAEMPQHEVCLDGFWMARTELTEAQWQAVVPGQTSRAPATSLPAVDRSWQDIQSFLARLNSQSVATSGRGRFGPFRLPTEAEWERACRAGRDAQDKLGSATELSERAWMSVGAGEYTSRKRLSRVQQVGGKLPNAWGFFDMLGNAWEWVQDGYVADAYRRHGLFNPVQEGDGGRRVIRGGSIRTSPWLTRCESRAWLGDTDRMDSVGFRLVFSEER